MSETFYNLTVATTNAEDMRNLLNNVGEVPTTHMPQDNMTQMSILNVAEDCSSCECECEGECGPDCKCYKDKVNEELKRAQKLAGITEDQTHPKIKILGIIYDNFIGQELFDHPDYGGVPNQLSKNFSSEFVDAVQNTWSDIDMDEKDEWIAKTIRELNRLGEDGYDYREMSKPEPNDFDRRGNDFDAFAKKGHLKKSKKRVNRYGDNPMAEDVDTWECDNCGNDDVSSSDTECSSCGAGESHLSKRKNIDEETDEDGNWIKPWEKKEDDSDDSNDSDDNVDDDDKKESVDESLYEKLLNEYEEFKLDESVSQWIIMNATKKVFGKIRLSLDEIIVNEYFNSGCIMIVNFDHGKSVFIYGSGQKPYGVVGETREFVQDTGQGYGRRGQLEIENFAVITDGEIITTANNIGLSEKRPLWVFK